jgi:rhomboid family protein
MFPIYDESKHPCRPCHFPYATVTLIAVNVLVFLIELANGADWALQYALVPNQVAHGEALYTVVTSMFIHASWLHLGGNMVYLWVFGNVIERHIMSSIRFTSFYFVCGFAATALQVAMSPSLTIPNLGASGAIAGILGGFLLLYPHDEILTVFLIPIPIPVPLSAIILVGFWFLFQLVSGLLSLGDLASGGVAYFAHVGGFVAGLALVRAFAQYQPVTLPKVHHGDHKQ